MRRRAVRAQEAEQPHERAPAARRGASGVVRRHGFVGYGSCSRPCPTSPKGEIRESSPRSARRSRGTRCSSTSTPTRITTVRSSRSSGDDDGLVESLLAGIATAVELIDLRVHARRPPARRRCGRRPDRPARTRRHVARSRGSALACASGRNRARAPGLSLRRDRRREAPGVLPARWARRAATACRVGRARSRRRPTPDRSALRRGSHRSAAPPRRVQRRPRDRRTSTWPATSPRPCVSRAEACAVCRRSACCFPSSGRVQVSMNVIDVDRAPLHEVVERVRAEATDRGVRCDRGRAGGARSRACAARRGSGRSGRSGHRRVACARERAPL